MRLDQELNERDAPEWTKDEILSLIKGIFNHGENEWSELIEDIEVHPSRTPN